MARAGGQHGKGSEETHSVSFGLRAALPLGVEIEMMADGGLPLVKEKGTDVGVGVSVGVDLEFGDSRNGRRGRDDRNGSLGEGRASTDH